MDERELQALFRDAPGDTPPPGFGPSDIAAASQRATARHRLRVAAASSAAALVLLGGGIFVAFGPLSSDGGAGGDSVAASAPELDAQAPGQPDGNDARLDDGGSPGAEAEAAPKQGGEASNSPGTGATRTERCETVDRRLATALAGELPVGPNDKPIPGEFDCDGATGLRQAAYRVDDGGFSGTVSVALIPAEQLARQSAKTTAGATARTADGDTVIVRSSSSDSQDAGALSQDDLEGIAARVAAKL